MQILAGQFGGHSLEQPKSKAVRPLTQKARAAIFDVLGDVSGKRVLDLYAGSGAAGLEAVSRGAAGAVFIEKSQAVAEVIKRNITALGLESETEVITWDVAPWLYHHLPLSIDVIIADPPYNQLDSKLMDKAGSLLGAEGILVVSQTSKIEPFTLQSVKLVKTKVYGDSALLFYKHD